MRKRDSELALDLCERDHISVIVIHTATASPLRDRKATGDLASLILKSRRHSGV